MHNKMSLDRLLGGQLRERNRGDLPNSPQRFVPAMIVALFAGLAPLQAGAGMGDSLVASGGNVTVRFEGQVASFDSLLSVNGGSDFFPNHGTLVGDTSDLGYFAAGTR